MFYWFYVLRKLWWFRHSKVSAAATTAVASVLTQKNLIQAAEHEEAPKFCPMCGQIPDGDRRMDHARAIAMEILKGENVKRSDLDLAISFEYWRKKHG